MKMKVLMIEPSKLFKICNNCNNHKTLEAFYTDKKAFDGKTTRCKVCLLEIGKEQYKKHLEKRKLYSKSWRLKNQDKTKGYAKKHNKKYYEENIEYFRKYSEINKKKKAEVNKLWRESKPWMHAAKEAKRRAIKISATPSWADLEAIKEFYKNCPKGYHVDHIIPLQGKNVCGLHVLENLQYLPAVENIKKSNKYGIINPDVDQEK